MLRISRDQATDDDIILEIWEGDDSALADLVMKHFGALERFVGRSFPNLGVCSPEDVVSEAIRRFWKCRDRYDGKRPLRSWLFGFAKHVAEEVVARRYRWMEAAALVSPVPIESVDSDRSRKLLQRLDELESTVPKLPDKVNAALSKLKPLYRDILEAYAFAGSVEPNAAALGRELGNKHNAGVPIPAGTIRVYKTRAKEMFQAELLKLGLDVSNSGRLR